MKGHPVANLLVIFGAGASYGAAPTNGAYSADAMPPLTTDLFHSRFDSILADYPLVDGLRGMIVARVARGSGLETVLANLRENVDPNIRAQVVEIPLYLRALVARTRTNRPTVYDQFLQTLQEAGHKVFFVTLNYDTLLEEAIDRKYVQTGSIGGFTDYVGTNREWQLAKVHGSVNWAYHTDLTVPSEKTGDFTSDYRSTLPHYLEVIRRGFDLGELFFARHPGALVQEGHLVYPALALPSDRKYGFICPQDHLEALALAIRASQTAIVIGCRGLDVDLMQFLRENSEVGPRYLMVVDPSEESRDIGDRFGRALQVRTGSTEVLGMSFHSFVEDGKA